MPASAQCEFCGAELPTEQGVRSHVRQTAACLAQQRKKYLKAENDLPDQDDGEKNPIPTFLMTNLIPADIPERSNSPSTRVHSEDESDGQEDMRADPPMDDAGDDDNQAEELPPPPKRPRVTVEEVEDEDDRWEQEFPAEFQAGAVLEECQTQFEKLREEREKEGLSPWYPFDRKEDWEIGRWLMTSGVSQSKMDEYLKLDAVRTGLKPSFHNKRAFLRRIDALPQGPPWYCQVFEIIGDEVDGNGKKKTESVELWYRNPLDCIRELLGNPAFKEKMSFVPRRFFRNPDGTNREWSEMWTAEWWWEIQQRLPAGASICPIIIASDKTQLTRFSGDQQAWPVYLTIGNIEKDTRRSASSYATVLLGYIPVSKLASVDEKKRSAVTHQLFHNCMRAILAPLVEAGKKGETMDCADGFVRRMFPILAAYIGDYPEQCLVACCRENSCPRCLVDPSKRGDLGARAPWREPEKVLEAIREQGAHTRPPEFKAHNLRLVDPFWSDLPHCDIFSCLTPDELHELHNGVFGDHLVNWSTDAMDGGKEELDARFRAMTPHPSLRHFKKGISLTSQWTGTERKNMEKVFLGVLANTTDPAVQRAAKGALDFIHYAHFAVHTDESLALMDDAWAAFHANKDIFIELNIRNHFNINKLHKLRHYTDSFRSRGTGDSYNTEHTERLHIDYAKVGYKATNRKAYIRQMTIWLRRQESIHKFSAYLQWSIPGYVAAGGVADEDADDQEDGDGDEEEEDEPSDPSSAVNAESDTEKTEASNVVTYAVAKTPYYKLQTAESIASDFHAPDFLPLLSDFLHDNAVISATQPANTSTFPVYSQITLSLPPIRPVTREIVRDTIKAMKGESRQLTEKGVRLAKAGQFDTVLVRVPKQNNNDSDLNGVRAARVRVIFRLPNLYGTYPEPLAYVEWYKPFNRPVSDLGMYQLSLSSRNHRQNAQIIPVSDIMRSCHLIPVFGRHVDSTWTSEQVLNQCKSFFLNPYLRHYDFYLLRYLPDREAARKAAEVRRARIRRLGRAGR
ncbi:hypothetical protein R3P38DRAFT_3314401 [Favolaschia claudopus]|uniref:Uncharacterized protein n=1 Tax=Favolaschia claudopus TaxID=2862362 RepID=A0AAW0BSU7_9AGAR